MSESVEAVLAAKRAALESQLGRMTALPPDASGISFGKRVGEGTSMAVERLSQIPAHDRLQRTLAEVVRAQQKLTEDSYGRCDTCGEPVGQDRLEAMPWATRCIACAANPGR